MISEIITAACTGDDSALALYKEKIDIRDEKGNTPLMILFGELRKSRKQYDFPDEQIKSGIRKLIELGAQLTLRNREEGYTLYNLALRQHSYDVLEYLLDFQTDNSSRLSPETKEKSESATVNSNLRLEDFRLLDKLGGKTAGNKKGALYKDKQGNIWLIKHSNARQAVEEGFISALSSLLLGKEHTPETALLRVHWKTHENSILFASKYKEKFMNFHRIKKEKIKKGEGFYKVALHSVLIGDDDFSEPNVGYVVEDGPMPTKVAFRVDYGDGYRFDNKPLHNIGARGTVAGLSEYLSGSVDGFPSEILALDKDEAIEYLESLMQIDEGLYQSLTEQYTKLYTEAIELDIQSKEEMSKAANQDVDLEYLRKELEYPNKIQRTSKLIAERINQCKPLLEKFQLVKSIEQDGFNLIKTGNPEQFRNYFYKNRSILYFDVNAQDGEKNTYPMAALKTKNLEMFNTVCTLLEGESDYFMRNKQGKNVVEEAIQVGNIQFLKIIQRTAGKSVKDLLNVQDLNGDPPIMQAALLGNMEMVSFLLAESHYPFIANKDGETLLTLAIKTKNKELLSLCLLKITEHEVSNHDKKVSGDVIEDTKVLLDTLQGFPLNELNHRAALLFCLKTNDKKKLAEYLKNNLDIPKEDISIAFKYAALALEKDFDVIKYFIQMPNFDMANLSLIPEAIPMLIGWAVDLKNPDLVRKIISSSLGLNILSPEFTDQEGNNLLQLYVASGGAGLDWLPNANKYLSLQNKRGRTVVMDIFQQSEHVEKWGPILSHDCLDDVAFGICDLDDNAIGCFAIHSGNRDLYLNILKKKHAELKTNKRSSSDILRVRREVNNEIYAVLKKNPNDLILIKEMLNMLSKDNDFVKHISELIRLIYIENRNNSGNLENLPIDTILSLAVFSDNNDLIYQMLQDSVLELQDLSFILDKAVRDANIVLLDMTLTKIKDTLKIKEIPVSEQSIGSYHKTLTNLLSITRSNECDRNAIYQRLLTEAESYQLSELAEMLRKKLNIETTDTHSTGVIFGYTPGNETSEDDYSYRRETPTPAPSVVENDTSKKTDRNDDPFAI